MIHGFKIRNAAHLVIIGRIGASLLSDTLLGQPEPTTLVRMNDDGMITQCAQQIGSSIELAQPPHLIQNVKNDHMFLDVRATTP